MSLCYRSMAIVERHISPDGVLQLIVELAADGDWSIGFDGCEWHTHGDILASMHRAGTPEHAAPEKATRSFVDDILQSRLSIVVRRVHGKIRDVRMFEKLNPDELNAAIAEYGEAGETGEARYWDGRLAVGWEEKRAAEPPRLF